MKLVGIASADAQIGPPLLGGQPGLSVPKIQKKIQGKDARLHSTPDAINSTHSLD